MQSESTQNNKLEIESLSKAFTENPIVMEALEVADVMILVINEDRQIIYANSKMLKGLGKSELEEIIGLRPGEAIRCVYADLTKGGCGSGLACQNCSALNLMLHSISLKVPKAGEVMIQRSQNGIESAVNLSVKMVPYALSSGACYMLTLHDNTDKVRRRELERIFFHDVLNTTGSIKNYLSLLIEEAPESMKEDMVFLDVALSHAIEDIQVQRALGEAENGDYGTHLEWVLPETVLGDVLIYFRYYREKACNRIRLGFEGENVPIWTDQRILRRILINMVKNALEASCDADQIDLCFEGATDAETSGRFSVRNPDFIDPQIQPRIFSRSFSTKGYGRGIGTYSIKLLGEKHLKGKVGFTSHADAGTLFYIILPGENKLSNPFYNESGCESDIAESTEGI